MNLRMAAITITALLTVAASITPVIRLGEGDNVRSIMIWELATKRTYVNPATESGMRFSWLVRWLAFALCFAVLLSVWCAVQRRRAIAAGLGALALGAGVYLDSALGVECDDWGMRLGPTSYIETPISLLVCATIPMVLWLFARNHDSSNTSVAEVFE